VSQTRRKHITLHSTYFETPFTSTVAETSETGMRSLVGAVLEIKDLQHIILRLPVWLLLGQWLIRPEKRSFAIWATTAVHQVAKDKKPGTKTKARRR